MVALIHSLMTEIKRSRGSLAQEVLLSVQIRFKIGAPHLVPNMKTAQSSKTGLNDNLRLQNAAFLRLDHRQERLRLVNDRTTLIVIKICLVMHDHTILLLSPNIV